MDDTLLNIVKKGAKILLGGGVVAYPTDTVYGLGACSSDENAVRRIYKIKERSISNPLPLLLSDVSVISRYCSEFPPDAKKLAEAFLPGALTLVMKKADTVSDSISGGKDTVALRVPDHPVTLALIRETGYAVIGTSANISGKASALTAEDVYSQLGNNVDFIIDGGRCPGGTESTVIDVTGHIPVILRSGAITRNEIEKICKVQTNNKE